MDNRAGLDRTSGASGPPDIAGGHGPALTVREAAQRAGVNERTVRRAITDRRLPAEQIHGSYHIAPADFDAWMSARRAPARTPAHPPGGHRSEVVSAGTADIAGMVPAALFREERARVERLERLLQDSAVLVGVMLARLHAVEEERDHLRAVTAGEHAPPDAAVMHESGPQRDDQPAQTSAPDKPVSDTLGLSWRRWFRRIVGK